MLVPIQTAMVNALAARIAASIGQIISQNGTYMDDMYVSTGAGLAFAAGSDGVDVIASWPEPDKPIRRRVVSVIPVGERRVEYLEPRMLERVLDVPQDPSRPVWRWQVAEVTQPIEIDVWAPHDAWRDEILAALDMILNGFPELPENGLLLQLGNGWSGNAVYDFGGPSNLDSPSSVAQAEYRSTLLGDGRAVLTIDSATANLARVIVRHIITTTVDLASPSA